LLRLHAHRDGTRAPWALLLKSLCHHVVFTDLAIAHEVS
jgi:hypothetical protein